MSNLSPSRFKKMLGWSVHLLTATGAIFPFFAILDIFQGEYKWAMIWLLSALFVDAIDGTFARALDIKNLIPNFDGHQLDWCVDFLNFVFVPIVFLYKIRAFPDHLAVPACILMLLVSCYHYGNLKALTKEHHWLGFPALWNGVAFYLWILGLTPLTNFIIVVIFSLLHFIPVRVIYPTQAKRGRRFLVPFFFIWILANLFLLVLYPYHGLYLLTFSLLGLSILMILSLVNTFKYRESF